jgi:NAD(P)-dependent dehydrogenase (short-subunit alcohol dehydrogenase family)
MVDILDRLESIGPVEVGVYNAGNAIWGPPLETKTADFEVVWRVGCLGGFIFGREVARRMLPRGYGTIICSGASAALRGRAAFAAFAAAKAGLRPARVVKHRKEWNHPTSWREILPGGAPTIFDLAVGLSRSSLPEFT